MSLESKSASCSLRRGTHYHGSWRHIGLLSNKHALGNAIVLLKLVEPAFVALKSSVETLRSSTISHSCSWRKVSGPHFPEPGTHLELWPLKTSRCSDALAVTWAASDELLRRLLYSLLWLEFEFCQLPVRRQWRERFFLHRSVWWFSSFYRRKEMSFCVCS